MLLDVKRSAAWCVKCQSVGPQVQPAPCSSTTTTSSTRISLTAASAQRMAFVVAATEAGCTFCYKMVSIYSKPVCYQGCNGGCNGGCSREGGLVERTHLGGIAAK
jgi:hypothetical protein